MQLEDLPYLREISLKDEVDRNADEYPFSIPAVQNLNAMSFGQEMTIFVGENGTGKSTVLEAIAVALGFNAEGGSANFRFGTKTSHSDLHEHIRLRRSHLRPRDGFFLRAESYYNVATYLEEIDSVPLSAPPVAGAYGGTPLHEQSHGESFMALLMNRFKGNGIYLLDEPEAALSPSRQLAALCRMRELVRNSSQFIISTHSPILMAYPDATIYQLDQNGYSEISYEETEHYQVTKAFLNNRKSMFREMFSDD